MKFKTLTIYSVLLLALFFNLVLVNPAQAGNASDITFEQKPLFSEANILPGDSVNRWIKVVNKLNNNLKVDINAFNITDPNRLGDMLNITVKKGATTLYQNTLSIFFDAVVIDLGSLTPYESAQYDFMVDFIKPAGNAYQNKILKFDISLIAGGDEAGGVGNPPGSSSSSGGGGGIFLSSFSQPENKTEVLGEAGQPILTVTKTVNKELANPGDTNIYYEIKVINSGNLTAYAVTLNDLLPVGLTFSGTDTTEKTVITGDIEPGDNKTLVYTADVAKDATAGDYINTVTVSASNHDPVQATAKLKIVNVSILGIEFASTGFKIIEFIGLLVLLILLVFAAWRLRRFIH